MTDAEFTVIQAVAGGDHLAFEILVKRYQKGVCNFVCRYLGDRAAAEDLAQEVFLRVYRAAPRFEPRGRVSTWIFKIAYNLCLNELKRRQRSRCFQELLCGQEESFVGTDLGRGETEALHGELSAAISRLPDNQRAALLLRVNEELSYAEIGKILSLSVSSVESLLFRARTRLRKELKKD
jgi:RNA polymerase sigma-70 factor (ECF subfamily)